MSCKFFTHQPWAKGFPYVLIPKTDGVLMVFRLKDASAIGVLPKRELQCHSNIWKLGPFILLYLENESQSIIWWSYLFGLFIFLTLSSDATAQKSQVASWLRLLEVNVKNSRRPKPLGLGSWLNGQNKTRFPKWRRVCSQKQNGFQHSFLFEQLHGRFDRGVKAPAVGNLVNTQS